MNLETKITIYKFTPQVFTLTHLTSFIQTMSLVVTQTLKVCPLQAYWVVE